eukprot:TRINITY_DN2502_c0_g1_i1.p1 TRINITY_DN2502_c0_g1~~TRINITY_DN2502_c0_g1_i1.p1  ORF type:complete len:490 (-),score=104.92 TRINITY_DN2502_c0_g1_i1:31-1353(-)
MSQVRLLAQNAATIPLTRVWISFFSPQLVYVKGSNTLAYTGLNASTASDAGFAELKGYIQQLQSAGVEVFLSVGGWNYNCFPYLYAYYSVGGYGTSTPNYWKIQQFGGGSLSGCTAANQYCYVCEPPSEGTTLDSFVIYPEPSYSSTWKQAVQFITQNAGGDTPSWDTGLIPGSQWTDPNTGISVTVPGNPYFITLQRDPYQDVVLLATDLGAAGIDVDYEEFWHADFFKSGTGPWTLYQTVYKYAAIVQDIILNIKAINPTLKLSTAAGAVGAWSGNWWGGNMKGVWLLTYQYYPSIINFMATGANAGGINVMTYDLSSNEQYHECPVDGLCALDQQVQYYMNTYQTANIPANVGYEIGTPAYPDPIHDPTHQLPLTKELLSSIISQTQVNFKGGFFWEMFKKDANSDEASPTDVAQAICKTVLPGSSRCSGTIPSSTF